MMFSVFGVFPWCEIFVKLGSVVFEPDLKIPNEILPKRQEKSVKTYTANVRLTVNHVYLR